MNKKAKDKKETQVPIDHITEVKNLHYTITLKENEISSLKSYIDQLRDHITNLEKDNSDLRASCILSYKNEKELKQARDMLDLSEKENKKLCDELLAKEKSCEEEINELKKRHENELTKLRNTLDSYHQKIENANTIQSISQKQEEHITELEQEIEKMRRENEEKLKTKEIKNQMKFTNLKKKMMENIQETQKNVTQLNIEYMDVSSKLTLLQNHQLLIQLEYQSQQIEELIKKKDMLEKKVFELSKDIEIHKEVEIVLAEKNKKLANTAIQISKKEDESSGNINACEGDTSTMKSLYVNSNIKDFSIATTLEKKILNLEKSLKKKSEDYQNLRQNFELIERKLKIYDNKYSGLFNLFEEGLKSFYEDEGIKNNNEIYVNLENIKHGDFSSFTKDEKYSIIVILMKHLLPLIKASDMKSSLENVNVKYHLTHRYLDDREFQKALKGKKSYAQRSFENLPSISKAATSTHYPKRSEDSRITNLKYQAVF